MALWIGSASAWASDDDYTLCGAVVASLGGVDAPLDLPSGEAVAVRDIILRKNSSRVRLVLVTPRDGASPEAIAEASQRVATSLGVQRGAPDLMESEDPEPLSGRDVLRSLVFNVVGRFGLYGGMLTVIVAGCMPDGRPMVGVAAGLLVLGGAAIAAAMPSAAARAAASVRSEIEMLYDETLPEQTFVFFGVVPMEPDDLERRVLGWFEEQEFVRVASGAP